MKKSMLHFDKESLRKQYEEVCPKYEELAKALKPVLEKLLEDEEIDFLDVYFRIKKFDDFCEKAERKGYKNPLEDTEDICGLRIVCFYDSDIEKIVKKVKREFEVVDWEDKLIELQPDQFGYRSQQGILKLKKNWTKTPQYMDLDHLKFELQVRTVLSHAWAEIDHQLAYKKKEYVPTQFRRKFSQLMALLEMADERFDELRKERTKYVKKLVKEGRFDVNEPVNLDSLQGFLDFYFPDRKSET